MTEPADLRHIASMTDDFGTFEHADHTVAREEHGYCVDDMARILLVTSREVDRTPLVLGLAQRSLRFLADAQGPTGRTRNRRSANGRWHGRRGVDDCWGRSVWALGAAACGTGYPAESARSLFDHAAQQRSRWPRAMAFATLGAAAVVDADPHAVRARALLEDAATLLVGLRGGASSHWEWPEARLSYANAAIPDALLAAGYSLRRPELIDGGLELLGWLLDRETRDGHLSVTPVGGAGPMDAAPGFDQQPIEVATLAEACARAAVLTGERRWIDGVRMAGAWFDGDNDASALMWDPATGGGYDGLHADGANLNQGTESTLALLSTRQQVGLLDQQLAR